jgi:hypothetical protein
MASTYRAKIKIHLPFVKNILYSEILFIFQIVYYILNKYYFNNKGWGK